MYLMIIILFGSYGFGGGKAIATVEFSTRAACDRAVTKFYEQVPVYQSGSKYYINGAPKAFCVERN